MITQHVCYWFCALHAKFVTLATGALGGLAAPIFITLSGVGVDLSIQRHPARHIDRLLITRAMAFAPFTMTHN
ncbi:uncharacterized protein Dvar_03560 [Desulfosarcina variabilis str. Montpellier]|uniref:hypothetical protein n=1 Tax=Desulfosarcina variabilis TaxID=2300 RepID=UPI003AFA6469